MSRSHAHKARIARTPESNSSSPSSPVQGTSTSSSEPSRHSEQAGLPPAAVRLALGNRALARQFAPTAPMRQGKGVGVPASSIQRKLTGSLESIQGIGHANLAPTIWQDILRELKVYEDREVELVKAETYMRAQGGAAPPDFPRLKTELMERLRSITLLVQQWIDRYQKAGADVEYIGEKLAAYVDERKGEIGAREMARLRQQNGNPDAPVDEARLPNVREDMSISQASQKYVEDPRERVLAQRMMALRLLLPRLNLEFNDLLTGRHTMTSGFTDNSATATTNRQARGGLNALDSVTYGARGHHFFKEDVGVDPNAEKNPAIDLIGVPEVDPQFGARSVAYARLDAMLNTIFARIEGANTRGMVVATEFATHVRGLGEAPKMGIVMEDARGPNRTGREAQSLLDQQLAQNNRVISANDPVLQRSLVRLQMLDAICGQIDRHHGNYYIHTDPAGQVTQVIGIDNDLAFGAKHTEIKETRKQYYGLPPIIDRNYAEAILQMDTDSVKSALDGVLGQGELNALITRIRLVQESLRAMPNAQMKRADQYDQGTAAELGTRDSYFGNFQRDVLRARYIRTLKGLGVDENAIMGEPSRVLDKYRTLAVDETTLINEILPIIGAYHRSQPITSAAWFRANAERLVYNDLHLARLLQGMPRIGGANWLVDVLPTLSASKVTLNSVQRIWPILVGEVQSTPPTTADELRMMIQAAIATPQVAARDQRRQRLANAAGPPPAPTGWVTGHRP